MTKNSQWYHTMKDAEQREEALKVLKKVNAKKGKTKRVQIDARTWVEVPVED